MLTFDVAESVRQQSLVFDLHTSVLDCCESGSLSVGERVVVGDAELQPDRLDIAVGVVAGECLIDDAGNLLAWPEHVDEIDSGLDLIE